MQLGGFKSLGHSKDSECSRWKEMEGRAIWQIITGRMDVYIQSNHVWFQILTRLKQFFGTFIHESFSHVWRKLKFQLWPPTTSKRSFGCKAAVRNKLKHSSFSSEGQLGSSDAIDTSDNHLLFNDKKRTHYKEKLLLFASFRSTNTLLEHKKPSKLARNERLVLLALVSR